MAKSRIYALAALVLIMALVLTACGTPTPAPTTVPPTKAVEPTKAPAAPTAAPTVAPTTAPTKAPTVNFPTRPVTVYTTHAAGSGIDMVTRIVMPYFQKYLGQTVVVQNLDGASGRTARAQLFKEKPDGYSLLATGFVSTQLGELVYDGAYKTADWTYIYNMQGGGDYMTIYVGESSPYKTLPELIAASKTKSMKIAISGLGASSHLFSVLLREKAGLVSTPVPFPAAQQLLAVVAGDVPASCDTASGIAGAEKVRILAVASDHGRSSMLPNVPSTGELGYPGLEVINTVGLVAPPGMSADIQKILADAMAKALADPALLADFKTAKIVTEPKDPVAFKAQVMAGYEALKSVIPMLKKDMP